jgi:hypothetical protein
MFHQPRRALRHNASTRHCHVSVGRGALPLQTSGKRCWPHLRVCCLPRGGSGDHCRYPTDRVPPFTSFKSRQRGGVQPRAVMYPAAPKSASQLRWAPRLPRVQRLRSPPPWYRGLRRRHVYRGSGTCLPTGRAASCHASCGPQWPTSLKHEENPSKSTCAVRLACSQRTHACFQGARR